MAASSAKISVSNITHNPDSIWNRPENDFHHKYPLSDITIKVDGHYHKLHRIILAVKSKYFEKLFNDNSMENGMKEIEINTIKSEVFGKVLKVIYGEKLSSILAKDNFASIFIAMDYLQIEIDLNAFENCIRCFVDKDAKMSFHRFQRLPRADYGEDAFLSEMLKFHDFTIATPQYAHVNLLHWIGSYPPNYVLAIRGTNLCYHLPLTEFEAIIKMQSEDIDMVDDQTKQLEIDRICAEWICFDIDKRLEHIVSLVNAVKSRYNYWYLKLDEKKHDKYLLIHEDKSKMLKNVARYFHELRTFCGEFNSESTRFNGSSPTTKQEENEFPARLQRELYKKKEEIERFEKNSMIEDRKKLETFLNNEYFHDVSIKVGNRSFRLHRIILASTSPYFRELFSNSSTSDIQEIKVPDEIDEITFSWIIRYIYNLEVQLTPKTNFTKILQACKLFKLQTLFENCDKYVSNNWKIIDTITETLIFAPKKFAPWASIPETGSTMKRLPRFYQISFETLKRFFASYEFSSDDEVIEICTKWIAHDKENRYRYINDLPNMINRNLEKKGPEYVVNYESDALETHDEEKIKRNLIQVFDKRNMIPSTTGNVLDDEEKPFFMISCEDKNCINFRNMNLEAITGMPALYVHYGSRTKSLPHRLPGIENEGATILQENLFLCYTLNRSIFFNLYNFSSKKFYSLPSHHLSNNWDNRTTLLNCNDQIYSCDCYGTVWKYSAMLNRWFIYYEIDKRSSQKYLHTSDNKRLFRFPIDSYEYNSRINYTKVGFYDERLKSWNSLPFPKTHHPVKCVSTFHGNLLALFSNHMAEFDERSQNWIRMKTISEVVARYPTVLNSTSHFNHFKPYARKEEIFYIIDNKLFSYSIESQIWTLKKETSTENIKIIHFND